MDKDAKDVLEMYKFFADLGRKFEDEEYCAKMDTRELCLADTRKCIRNVWKRA